MFLSSGQRDQGFLKICRDCDVLYCPYQVDGETAPVALSHSSAESSIFCIFQTPWIVYLGSVYGDHWFLWDESLILFGNIIPCGLFDLSSVLEQVIVAFQIEIKCLTISVVCALLTLVQVIWKLIYKAQEFFLWIPKQETSTDSQEIFWPILLGVHQGNLDIGKIFHSLFCSVKCPQVNETGGRNLGDYFDTE